MQDVLAQYNPLTRSVFCKTLDFVEPIDSARLCCQRTERPMNLWREEHMNASFSNQESSVSQVETSELLAELTDAELSLAAGGEGGFQNLIS